VELRVDCATRRVRQSHINIIITQVRRLRALVCLRRCDRRDARQDGARHRGRTARSGARRAGASCTAVPGLHAPRHRRHLGVRQPHLHTRIHQSGYPGSVADLQCKQCKTRQAKLIPSHVQASAKHTCSRHRGWCFSYLPVEGEEDPAGEPQHLHQLEQLRPVAPRRRRLGACTTRAITSACLSPKSRSGYGQDYSDDG
jgi:hypothetical protein